MRVERYDVRMDFDPPNRSFRGTVGVEATTDPGPLTLYAADLTIDRVEADGVPARYELDATTQELRIHDLAPGAHGIRIDFAGRILPNGLAGMYVSPFGGGREILTTQMYPAGTRRFFPCIDVPAVKAEIRMEVTVPSEARVVFNTDPVAEVVEGARKRVRFAPTPRMSTYLLYLGIGPFEETERSDGNLRVIVAHPPGRAEAAGFALDHAARFVRAYESYYAIPYPLPKLHLVAVPSFWAGAMENWGAIAFRETTLLVDATTDAFSRRWNRLVLAHEIAHQWFGNLVTNAWWGDFWLNEAFANFVSYHTVDRVHPGEATWPDFAGREMTRGFSQDALATAHPIEVEIRAPEEIGEIADGITYGKGASILRMIEAYIGEASFRRGVTAYLNDHRYDAATGADLWRALDAHSDAPVSRIMREWITRPGHPIVECRVEAGQLVVTQRRFHADGRRDAAHWPVPLVLELDGRAHRTLLEERPWTMPFPPGTRLRVNPERTGFFLTGLDAGLRAAAVDRWDELSEVDQWGMLLDAVFQLGSGDLGLDDYLALVERARTTPRYLPAVTAARQLRGLVPFFDAQPRLADSARRFLREQMDRIGRTAAPGEPETHGVLRNALGWASLHADPAARRGWAESYRDARGALDTNLLDVATAAYVAEGGAAAWREVREQVARAVSDEEAFRGATALAHASGEAEMAATYELLDGPALSASRIWDVLRVANGVARHAASLWAYYARRLPALDERWKGTPLLSTILPEALPMIGVGRGDPIRAYFAAHRFPGAERGIAEALERLRVREILARRLGALKA